MPRSQGVSEQVANEAYDATEAAAAAGDLDTTFNDARKKRCGTSAASSTHTQLTRARAVVRGGHGVAYSHHHLMQLELSRTTPPTATACAPVLGAQTGLSGRLPLSSSPLGRPRVVRWYHELPTNSPLPCPPTAGWRVCGHTATSQRRRLQRWWWRRARRHPSSSHSAPKPRETCGTRT